jgi:hypothetical protein
MSNNPLAVGRTSERFEKVNDNKEDDEDLKEFEVPPPDPVPELSYDDYLQECILFIGIKILHEMLHLLHRRCSNKARKNRTPIKVIKDELVSGDSLDSVYSDLGELIEKDLFGGLWHMTSLKDHVADQMQFGCIVIYPSNKDPIGRFLDVANSIITPSEVLIMYSGVHHSHRYTGTRIGMTRLSTCCVYSGRDSGGSRNQEDENESVGEHRIAIR